MAAPAVTGGATAAAATATPGGRRRPRERDEIRIPLMREEIGIEKVARESGHVRIHKTIHTEEKRFSVPVTREEVIIEHVAVGRDAALSADAAFSEDTVDVPLYEEEVRVSKRPILDEEVVVRTVARSVEREGSAMLRHEEAEDRGHPQERRGKHGRERRRLRRYRIPKRATDPQSQARVLARAPLASRQSGAPRL